MPPKNFAGKDLSRANLDRADLTDADLRDARMRDAYAREADLSGADLTGADLTGADLRGSRLDGATVDGAALDGTDLRNVDLTGLNVNSDVTPRQAAKNNGHRPGVPSSSGSGPTRSTIESVVAIKVDGEPCCVEILVAGIDQSAANHEAAPGMMAFAHDEGLVVLTLEEAQALHAKLEAAIRALGLSSAPVGVS